MAERAKPKGRTGPVEVSDAGYEWAIIDFPDGKEPREKMIAHMFARAANNIIYLESPEPRYPPFGDPEQNPENDLDFTILTNQGVMLMELTEFAPLQQHGPEFKNAPRHLDASVKSGLLLDLVQEKSQRQGGTGRFLVIYTTEEGFWIDPSTVEIMRRALGSQRPRFERIYYLAPLGADTGSVTEIFPGQPHHFYGKLTDEELLRPATFVHPHDLPQQTQQWEFTGTMLLPNYGASIIRIRLLGPAIVPQGLKRFSKPFIFVQGGQGNPSMPKPQPRRPDEPEDDHK